MPSNSTPWSNTEHFSTVDRLYTTGGVFTADIVGVTNLSDAFSQHDAVYAQRQSAGERLFKGVAGALQLGGTAFGGAAAGNAARTAIRGGAGLRGALTSAARTAIIGADDAARMASRAPSRDIGAFGGNLHRPYAPHRTTGLSALDDISIPANANTATRIPRRLSSADMAELQRTQNVEFAQVYITGPGRNGGGGQYLLIRGTQGNVNIPVGPNVRIISHTHPTTLHGQTVPLRASGADRNALGQLQDAGSPQRISTVVTESGDVIRFSRTRNSLGN